MPTGELEELPETPGAPGCEALLGEREEGFSDLVFKLIALLFAFDHMRPLSMVGFRHQFGERIKFCSCSLLNFLFNLVFYDFFPGFVGQAEQLLWCVAAFTVATVTSCCLCAGVGSLGLVA